MDGRFVLLLLLATTVAGCMDGSGPRPVHSEEPPAAEILGGRGTDVVIAWSGNVTHDAAVSWSFAGKGRCAVNADLHIGGGASTNGAGILFDDGAGFLGLYGSTTLFVEAHAAGQHVRAVEAYERTWSLSEVLQVSNGSRVLVFGRDLLPSPDLDGDSIRVKLRCHPDVEVVGLNASREVVVLSDHGDGNGVGATVGVGPSVDVATRVERTFTSERVDYSILGQVSAVVDLRVTHPDGQAQHIWYGWQREAHAVPGGDLVIEVDRAGTQVAFLYLLFFGLHPVASLGDIHGLPGFGADEWDWDGSTP